MIKVISFTICPFVQRVTAALEAKRIPYDIEYINLRDKPDWFLAISPNGQVPVMITESGVTLFESDAIVEYIDDAYGQIDSSISHEQRALDRAWSYLGTKHYLLQCSTMRSQTEDEFMTKFANLRRVFEKVEDKLAHDMPQKRSQAFFNGEQISQVDIAWLPLLHRADIVRRVTGCDFFGGLSTLQAWQAQVLANDFADKTVSDDFVARFSDFYLSNTFLGDLKNEDKTLKKNTKVSKSAACCNGCC